MKTLKEGLKIILLAFLVGVSFVLFVRKYYVWSLYIIIGIFVFIYEQIKSIKERLSENVEKSMGGIIDTKYSFQDGVLQK